MRQLFSAFDRLVVGMHRIAGAFLILMVVITIVDIATRTLFSMTGGAFSLTVRGAVEMTSFSLLIMILFTLPYSVGHAQVIVDVFTDHWGKRAKSLSSGFYLIGFCLLGVGMSLGFYESAFRVAETGQTTQDLQVPLWIIYAIASFAAAVLAIRSLEVGLRRMFGKENADTGAETATGEGMM